MNIVIKQCIIPGGRTVATQSRIIRGRAARNPG